MGEDNIPLPPEEFIGLVGSRVAKDYESTGLHVFELVRDRCSVKPWHHVLDIGSGSGRVAVHFTRYMNAAGTYDGFDIVLPMVEWCQENISNRFPHFRFQYAPLSNTHYSGVGSDAQTYKFPYADNTFDVVFAASVFTHLMPASAEQYARETARVLKPEGRALLTFYIINDESRRQRANGEKIIPFAYERGDHALQSEDNPEGVIAFEERRAISLLEAAGLRIDRFSYGFWRKAGGWTYQDAFLVSKRP